MAYTTINKGSSYFNTVLWTGNGTTQSITGVGFKPDFVWMKARSSAGTNHHEFDSVRVVSSTPQRLFPNLTSAEDGNFGTLDSFDTDGFTLGSNVSGNQSGVTFVGWNWLANNTSGSSNTAGSITSTVAANTTAGFSIVSYTGTGANATVGHGLGVAPRMIIIKTRSGVSDWGVYHESMTNTKRILLNSAGASGNFTWGGSPTSSVFYVNNDGLVNGSGSTYIAYCFAPIKGYSAFGSYLGNGDANGRFIYTGFKPAFVMVKSTGTGANWLMQNNKTLGYNASNSELYANLTNAEVTADRADLLSNGFKARINSGENNSSGVTYIYMAFASNPFVTSGGIPVTAR